MNTPTQQQHTDFPTPPGSKQHPFTRHTRTVDPTSNPSQIVGIPKIIALMAGVKTGDALKVWFERSPEGHARIVFEKIQ